MARPSSPTDYTVDVPGLGKFVFARRKVRDTIAVEIAYGRHTEGLADIPTFAANLASALADLSVLMVSGPPKWGPDEVEELDGDDDDTYAMIQRLWEAFRRKEQTFRRLRTPDAPLPGA